MTANLNDSVAEEFGKRLDRVLEEMRKLKQQQGKPPGADEPDAQDRSSPSPIKPEAGQK